ncbi:hypothetical protein VTK56DRAFT_2082 [Thermocarpiscus australiensis]
MPRSSSLSAHPDASSTSAPSPLQRLPVNPRRKKVAPDERKRVATACNSCNVRRIKCSGERPCRQCTSAQRACLYPEPVEKVTIPKAELESLRRRCASLERRLAATEPADAGNARQGVGSPSALSRSDTTETMSLDGDARLGGIDGRMLADPAGNSRYLGETSGATFLDTLKELIATALPLARVLQGNPGETPAGAAFLGSVGRYQTHDSRPLMLPQAVDPLTLPSESEIAAALSELRYFIQDGNGLFGSGGIFFWPFEDPQSVIALASTRGVKDSDGAAKPGPHRRALALYHAAFAVAHTLTLREPNSAVDGQLGEVFFARARSLLGNLLDRTIYTISDLAVLAMMAFYLIENNRRDAAYISISSAMTISIVNGVHKGWLGDEVGVRTFWTVYILDRWLGCVMGRPPTIPDDAITLPLPREVPGLPSPAGLRAHVELCKISDYIVYNSYRAGGRADVAKRATVHVDRALDMLNKWHANLPDSLRLPDALTLFPADLFSQASVFGHGPSDPLGTASGFGRDRACWALHMSYNQLVILSVRPAMLMAVWKAIASIVCIDQPFDVENHPQIGPIRACSDAARRNLRLGRLMRLHSPRHKLLLPDLHHIFNATVILTMHMIVFVNLRTQDLEDISWATEVFEGEAETGSEYAKDCARVLRDLQYLVHQLRNPIHDPNTKQILLSNEGVFRDLLPDEASTPRPKLEPGTDVPLADGRQASTPERQGDTLYQKVAAIYQTLTCWWKADYMQFYNTFLS